MGRTACTEPQCLYSTAILLLPLWAVRPVQSLSVCTRVHFTLLTPLILTTCYAQTPILAPCSQTPSDCFFFQVSQNRCAANNHKDRSSKVKHNLWICYC